MTYTLRQPAYENLRHPVSSYNSYGYSDLGGHGVSSYNQIRENGNSPNNFPVRLLAQKKQVE